MEPNSGVTRYGLIGILLGITIGMTAVAAARVVLAGDPWWLIPLSVLAVLPVATLVYYTMMRQK